MPDNNEARSHNHCCHRKEISMTYSLCVFMCVCSLNYPECNAHVPYYIVICGLFVSTRILQNISQMTRCSVEVGRFSRFLQGTQDLRVSRGTLFQDLRHQMEWASAPRPGRLYPQERPGTHCTGGWVDHVTGLDGRKIPGPSRPQLIRYTDGATRPTSIEVIEHNMCVLIFAKNLYETFLILRRIKRDIIMNVYRSSLEVLFILVRFS